MGTLLTIGGIILLVVLLIPLYVFILSRVVMYTFLNGIKEYILTPIREEHTNGKEECISEECDRQ